ncbi:MAG: TrmH family RNA methyltransferase [Solirubrobacteraceae bacterium]
MPITSPHNEKLKELRRLRQRRRDRELSGRFVAEGEDLLVAADAAGWTALERFCAAGSGLPGTEVAPEILAGVSELGSGSRTIAVYQQRWSGPAQLPLPRSGRAGLWVYLHGISDPGNVGAVLRSAAAFGAGCVAFGPDTADPFGPKAVRASMGAVFTVPVLRATPQTLPGVTVALDAHGPASLASIAAALGESAPVSLLVGAERQGLPQEILAAADHVATIPILTDSLNAATAAAIALYEFTRSRLNT